MEVPWRFVELQDRGAVMQALEGANLVVHLGEIPHSLAPFMPDEIYAQNTRAGGTVFQSAKLLGVDRIIYASSAQAYGSWGENPIAPAFVPLDETHPLRPQNVYALSKVANEGYLRMLAGLHPELDAVIFRFPGSWGVHRPWSETLEYVTWNEDFRDGLGTYVHQDDLVHAIVLASETPKPGVRTYNVAADDIFNLMPVQDYLALHWPDVQFPADWPSHKSWLSSERIRHELGWKPQYNLSKAYAKHSK